MVPLLVIITVVLIAGYFIMYFSKEKSGNWILFFSRGKEAGFTMKDLEQIKKIVAGCNIKEPSGIFKSQSQFETVIRSMVNAVRLSGESNDP